MGRGHVTYFYIWGPRTYLRNASVHVHGWSPTCKQNRVICGRSLGHVHCIVLISPTPLCLRNRGVVVRGRGETPFRQIFWSRNGAPAILLATGGTLTLKRSGNIMSYALGCGPNCPQTRDLASKNLKKKFLGVTPPDPLSGTGRPPPAPSPSTTTRRARGRKLSPLLGSRSRKPSSQIKIFHCTSAPEWLETPARAVCVWCIRCSLYRITLASCY